MPSALLWLHPGISRQSWFSALVQPIASCGKSPVGSTALQAICHSCLTHYHDLPASLLVRPDSSASCVLLGLPMLELFQLFRQLAVGEDPPVQLGGVVVALQPHAPRGPVVMGLAVLPPA